MKVPINKSMENTVFSQLVVSLFSDKIGFGGK
jgi:hypothetical protein